MDDFRRNPCRFHPFEVFALDPAETDLRALRSAAQAARDRLRYGKLLARDGSELELTEADLNDLENQLFDPLRRLQAEQLVHPAHPFAQDPELAACLEALAGGEADPLPELLAAAASPVFAAAIRTLAGTLQPPPLADDLPWPPEPEPLETPRESLEDAVLRER